MSHAVVIFARSPQREARAKGLPSRSGAALFRAVVAAWIRAAKRARATPVIASTAADKSALMSIGAGCVWIEQRGSRFGQRLASAAAAAFELGYDKILIGGIDAPPPDLIRAFELLDRGITVIAPARDGGVNLIGLTAPAPALLRARRQGERDAVARFREHVPELVLLETQSDIDALCDIPRASRERAWIAFRPLLFGCTAGREFLPLAFGVPRHAKIAVTSRAPPPTL